MALGMSLVHVSPDRREHLTTMSQRVLAMRKALRDALIAVGAPGNWDHIVNQRGLFTYSGLSGAVISFACIVCVTCPQPHRPRS